MNRDHLGRAGWAMGRAGWAMGRAVLGLAAMAWAVGLLMAPAPVSAQSAGGQSLGSPPSGSAVPGSPPPGPQATVAARSTLDRIARTATLRAGTRDDAPPFAFRDANGRFVGFSVDLIEEVRKALTAKLGREIRTDHILVTTQTRLNVIEDGSADLVCETATVTWPREQRVDFTLPIFRDGTRVLTYRDTLNRVGDLSRLRIGIVRDAITGRILLDRLPGATILPFPSMPTALQALEAAQVDAIANVGIVLRGLIPSATRRQGLVIVPRGDALGHEAMACLLPQNDSQWRDFVNGVLRDQFHGIEAYRGGYFDIYQRWFGRDAELAYPLDESAVRFFQATLLWLD